MSKKVISRKRIFFILLLVIGLLSTFAITFHLQTRKQDERNNSEFSAYLNKIENNEKKAEKFYINENHDFILNDVASKELESYENEIVSLSKELNKFKNQKEYKTLSKRLKKSRDILEDVSYKQDKEVLINSFFKEEAIKNSEVNEKPTIVDNLTLETIETFYIEEKVSEDSEWRKVLTEISEDAKEQVELIAVLTEKVNGFYEEETIIENPQREVYESVQKEISNVRNEKAKNELLTKMVAVLAKIESNETFLAEQEQESELEAQKEAEEVVKAETEKDVKASYDNPASNDVKTNTEVPNSSNKATSGNNSTTSNSQAGYNESESSKKPTPSTGSSSNNSNSENSQWQNTDPITGGDSYGGIYDNLEDVPGLETGNPAWD